MDELEQHVTFADELRSKWEECLLQKVGQALGKMCEECDKLVQNNKHLAAQVSTSTALRGIFMVCLDAFPQIALNDPTLPDEDRVSHSTIILVLSKYSQHIHNLHDECAGLPKFFFFLHKYIDAVVQLKNGTEDDLKKMEAGNATNMLRVLRGFQDKGSLIVSSIHEVFGEHKVRCYKLCTCPQSCDIMLFFCTHVVV